MAFWVYILRCSDGSYYTGQTDDIERRPGETQNGIKCTYTRRRRPVEPVFSEYFEMRSEARDAEKQIKGWSRLKKEALVRRDWDELVRLSNLKSEPLPKFVVPNPTERESKARITPDTAKAILAQASGLIASFVS